MYVLGLVIVCIICIMWYLDTLDVPKLLFLSVMGVIFMGCNTKSGGGFICDITKQYGNRCKEATEKNELHQFSSKNECETYCMRRKERMHIHNIGKNAKTLIHMIYDHGWNFPVPRWFLQQLADSVETQEQFYKTTNRASMRLINTMVDTTNFGLIIREILGVEPKIVRINSTPLELSDNLQYYLIITSVGTGEHISHANSVIIGKNRKIIHIEPNFGTSYVAANPEDYEQNVEKITKLLANYLANGYTMISTNTCLPGMQIVSELGGVCATWSEFLGIWMAMNMEKSPDEVFRYAIGSHAYADIMLQIYVFYARSAMKNPTTILEIYRPSVLADITKSRKEIIAMYARILAAPDHIQSVVMSPFSRMTKHAKEFGERVTRTGDLTISFDEQSAMDTICHTTFWDSWFNIIEKEGVAAGYIEYCKMFGIDMINELPRLQQPELEKFTLYVEKHMGATDDQIITRQSMNIDEESLWYNTIKLYEYYKTPNKTYMQIMTDQ